MVRVNGPSDCDVSPPVPVIVVLVKVPEKAVPLSMEIAKVAPLTVPCTRLPVCWSPTLSGQKPFVAVTT